MTGNFNLLLGVLIKSSLVYGRSSKGFVFPFELYVKNTYKYECI